MNGINVRIVGKVDISILSGAYSGRLTFTELTKGSNCCGHSMMAAGGANGNR